MGDRLRAMLRRPDRALGLVGGTLLVVGAFLPWLEGWLPYVEWFEVSGFQRAGDGIIALFVGIGVIAVAWSDRVAENHHQLAATLAGGLGLAAILLVRLAGQDLGIYLESLTKYGGKGGFLPGYWITVTGAGLAMAGGIVRAWHDRGPILTMRIKLPITGTATAVGGVVGTIAGIYGGAAIGGFVTSGVVAGIAASLLILFAIAFGFIGALVGGWLGNRAGRALDRARGRTLGGGASRA